jgi:hypothetical protein
MKRLKLKHADLSLDAERWLRIGKHNGEEIAVQLESEEPTVLAKWLEAASVRSQKKIAKRTTEKPIPKRKLMEPRGDKRYVRRNKKGGSKRSRTWVGPRCRSSPQGQGGLKAGLR